jgi:alpha-tubulin suppressor-like RCC1 family protein
MHVYAWGAGTQGQLGNGKLQDSLVPTSVTGLEHQNIQSIVCGGNTVVCMTGKQQLIPHCRRRSVHYELSWGLTNG